MVKNTFKKVFGILLIITFIIPQAAGCNKKLPPSAEVDKQYEWLDENFTDSSQLSAWDQQMTMNLTAWNTDQTGNFSSYNSSNDVVSAEIKRVTGVSINKKTSFDNGGLSAAAKYNALYITDTLPDIAYGRDWIDTEEVYDLTELIKEYCPTIMERMPDSVWDASVINGGIKNKVYSVPYGLGDIGLSDVDPLADASVTKMFEFYDDYYPYILVRDDILTAAYPQAKTQAQIEQLFAQQGAFTKEQLFDVPITSAAQFRTEFLPKIYNAIHADTKYQIASDRWVNPMLITDGSDRDTWSFLGLFIPKLLGATATHTNNYFSYWDVESQSVKLLYKQDFYKNETEEWVKLISGKQYGLSTYGMTMTNGQIQNELNSGYYAIGYPSACYPTGYKATYKGQQVSYRKVYMQIEKDDNHFEFFTNGAATPSGVSIFKKSVRESDLPQILRWLDFQCSRLGDKLFAWGPESAGLFEYKTEGGEQVRRFKSDSLANQMVYNTAVLGSDVQKYNLSNGFLSSPQTTFPFFYVAGSIDHPKCTYDLSQLSDLANTFFSSAVVCPEKEKTLIAKTARIDKWTESDLTGVETIWGRRKTIEDELKAVLSSGSNFSGAYSRLISVSNTAGWTDSYFSGAFQESFLIHNEHFLQNFLKDY